MPAGLHGVAVPFYAGVGIQMVFEFQQRPLYFPVNVRVGRAQGGGVEIDHGVETLRFPSPLPSPARGEGAKSVGPRLTRHPHSAGALRLPG